MSFVSFYFIYSYHTVLIHYSIQYSHTIIPHIYISIWMLCFVIVFLVLNLADDNSLTGTIPSEIGLLTELTFIELSKWLIWGSIYLFISAVSEYYFIWFNIHTKMIPHIYIIYRFGCFVFFALLCLVLVFLVLNLADDNSLTGTIPSEIGYLTKLTTVSLCKWLIWV